MVGGLGLESRTLIFSILEALRDPVVLIDGLANVHSLNSTAKSLWPSLVEGRPFSFSLRYPDLNDAIRAVLSGEPERSVELIERIPVEQSFLVRVSPLSEVTHRGIRNYPLVIVVFTNLTEARRLESTRVDFVANASHELRTPLASLLGFIETLQGSARNDPKAHERFLGIMRDQAQRMSRLIDDLLSLSRVEMSEHKQPVDHVDIGLLTQEMVDMLKPLARDRGVEINYQPPFDPIIVIGDRDELLRLIENLIENAIKYGQSGGKVEISVDHSNTLSNGVSEVELSVRDYGPGIASEFLPRLTERFYQIDIAASRDKGGTGLGLAIVKHIVNRHRGRLVIESKVGAGSIFRVSLPKHFKSI
ncbi:MAG: ATP-binding protein [Hyphomicrobiales bacterium]